MMMMRSKGLGKDPCAALTSHDLENLSIDVKKSQLVTQVRVQKCGSYLCKMIKNKNGGAGSIDI